MVLTRRAFYRQAVRHGYDLLAMFAPGWENQLDLASFSLGDLQRCLTQFLPSPGQSERPLLTEPSETLYSILEAMPNIVPLLSEQERERVELLPPARQIAAYYGFEPVFPDVADRDLLVSYWKRLLGSKIPSRLIERAVIRGAYILDLDIPEWYTKIDQSVLDLRNGARCILGQLSPTHSYHLALTLLAEIYHPFLFFPDLASDRDQLLTLYPLLDTTEQFALLFGFQSCLSAWKELPPYWHFLWIDEIEQRKELA